MIKRFADLFFRWFCHPDYYSEIQGDLEELYQRNIQAGTRFSQWRYLFQVLGLFRPAIIRSFSQPTLVRPVMLRNYFKIGYRSLLRHKLYTAINIIGLAFGLSAFLLISAYIRFEENYDSFFKNPEQIYRLSTVQLANGQIHVKDAMTFHPAAKALKDELPEITNYTVTYKFDALIFRNGEKVIQEKHVISADSNFLDIFDHKILKGSANEMLKEPHTLVLTKSKAAFYFGEEDPIGKTIEILGAFNRPFKVTGVMEDLPANTHYGFDMIISDESMKVRDDYNSWRAYNYYSYLKLDAHVEPSILADKLDTLSKKYLSKESILRFHLYPVRNIHLKSDFTYEAEIPGNEKTVSFLKVIALFILIIAWVNYINLSTARAVNRAKEVGLRKVIGAYRMQLVSQFLIEALLVNLLAAMLALLMAELALPYYNQLVGKEINQHVWNNLLFLQNLTIFFVMGTLVSGFYPALVLSGFKPIVVLKGKYRSSKGGTVLRKGLVVVQFSVSMVLIASTFIVYRQVQFMQGKELGISTDYVVGFTIPSVEKDQEQAHQSKVEAFRETLRKHTAIEKVASTSNLPGGDGADINSSSGTVHIKGITNKIDGTFYIQYIDEHLLDALDMRLLAGKNLTGKRGADSLKVIVNEAFLRSFNIADIGKMIHKHVQFGDDDPRYRYDIIGVVKDFHRTSLKTNVEPTLYWN